MSARPDPKHVCTSYVERQNLNVRMGMRRCTRLTSAFSKKAENQAAMAAGAADHVWELEEIVRLAN